MLIDHAAGAFIVEGLPVADLCINASGPGISERDFSACHISYCYLRTVRGGAEGKLAENHSTQRKNAERNGAHAEQAHGDSAKSDQSEGKIGKRICRLLSL